MSKACGVLVLATAVALAGCGGGGGSAVPVVSSTPDITIDVGNGVAVTGAAFGAAFETSELGGLVADDSVASAAPARMSRLADRMSAKTQLSVVPVGPVTEACLVAGSTTLSGELANPLTFTAGDRITVAFMNCDDGDGQVVDGTLEFVVDSFSGDVALGTFDLTVTLTLTSFQVMEGGESTLANGSASVRIDTTQFPLSRVVVSGDSLQVTSGADSAEQTDFDTVLTEDGGQLPIPVTLQASGNLDSSEIGGFISYSTAVTFQGFAGEYPYAGEFLVDGAGGSSARLIALDNQNVRIEIDSDGDGVVDDVIDTTWQELDN